MNTQFIFINKHQATNNQQGLTLIEVLVTVVISSIGLMGLVALQFQAIQATTDSGNRSQAIWLFNDLANRIHANEANSSDYVTNGIYLCNNAPTVCATYNTGSETVVAQNCTNQEMAAWDLFEIACGTPKDANFLGNAITYLPSATISVDCANGNGACPNGDPLQITLRWKAKSDTESITGSARTATSGDLIITDIITP